MSTGRYCGAQHPGSGTMAVMLSNTTTQSQEPDKRYRVLVILQRSDRPRYYDFYCFKCQYKVCELVNTEVRAMQDLVSYEDLHTIGASVRCDGRYQGGHCPCWYTFSLSDGQAKARVQVTTFRATISPSGPPQ